MIDTQEGLAMMCSSGDPGLVVEGLAVLCIDRWGGQACVQKICAIYMSLPVSIEEFRNSTCRLM